MVATTTDEEGALPRAAQQLTRLARVGMALVDAEDVSSLIATVAEQGLAALGCSGGAVAVPDPQDPTALISYITASYGAQVQLDYVRLSLDEALPVCRAARERRTVLLPDEAASLAFSARMAAVNAATGAVAWASVPMVAGDRLIGVLTAGWDLPQGFADDEVALLHAFAAQCAQALVRVEAQGEQRRGAEAVARMSESLQRSLLTEVEVPQPDHLELVARYVPAAEQAQVGGDWYDAFVVGDGATNLVVGDVSGHDLQAAVAMAQVRGVLRGVAHALAAPPATVLSALDRAMRDLEVGSLATAVLARVERGPGGQGGRVLRWSNAGHPPPLLIEPGGRAELLVAGDGTAGVGPDLLLGLASAAQRHDHVRTLATGATVVLYTDGLVERRGEDLDASLERLRRAGERLGGLGLNEMCDALLREGGLVDGARGEDDVAILALRSHAEGPRSRGAGTCDVAVSNECARQDSNLQPSDP